MNHKFIEIFNIPGLFELIVNYYIEENINNIMHFIRIIAPVNTLFSNNIEFLNLWGSLIYSKLNYSLQLNNQSELFENLFKNIFNCNEYGYGFIFSLKLNSFVFGYISNKIIEFPPDTEGYCIFIDSYSIPTENNNIIIPNKYKTTNINSISSKIWKWKIFIDQEFLNKIINHPNVFEIKIE